MTWRLPDPADAELFQPPPFRWRILDLVVFGVFFALTVLTVILLTVFFLPNPTGVQLILVQCVMDLMFVGCVFFLIKVVHRLPFWQSINWTRNHQFPVGRLVGLAALLVAGAFVVSAVFPTSEPTALEKLLNSPGAVYVLVLLGVGIAPGAEEIIFRGFLFRVFEDVTARNVAILITAVLFTGLHLMQLWGNWGAVLWIFVVGYVLSSVRARSNSLIPSFVIHTTYNAALFMLSAVGTAAQRALHH